MSLTSTAAELRELAKDYRDNQVRTWPGNELDETLDAMADEIEEAATVAQ